MDCLWALKKKDSFTSAPHTKLIGDTLHAGMPELAPVTMTTELFRALDNLALRRCSFPGFLIDFSIPYLNSR